MADIFISYAKEDREGVAHFASALSDEGYDVWWDTSLLSGDEWRAEVERQLKAAGAVIVCWSKAANESRWVAQEAEEARRLRKLVPVSISLDDAGGSLEPPFGFRDVQATPLAQWFRAPRHELLLPVFAALERVPGAPSVPARFRRLKQELNAERERRAAIDVRANELGQALAAAEAATAAAEAQSAARASAVIAPGLGTDPLRMLTAGAAVIAAVLAGVAAIQGGSLSSLDNRTRQVSQDVRAVHGDLINAARIACGHWASDSDAYYAGGRPYLRSAGAKGDVRVDVPQTRIEGDGETDQTREACRTLLRESYSVTEAPAEGATPAPATP